MQIIKASKRRKRLTEIFIDDGCSYKISTFVFENSGIHEGDEITPENFQELIASSDRYRARDKALYLLTYRDHSKKELIDKISIAVSPEAAEEAAEYADSLGMLDDTRYAGNLALSLINTKGYSKRRALFEMQQKGIDRSVAETALEAVEVSPDERICRIIKSKYPAALGDEKIYNRAVSALLRYGYGYSEIKAGFELFRNSENTL